MSTVRMLAGVALWICLTQAHAATYVWDAQKAERPVPLRTVTLMNKTVLAERRNGTPFEQAITQRPAAARQSSVLLENDFAQIEAAYPNQQQALAVLVSDGCAGSGCPDPSLTLLVPVGTELKIYPIGSASKISLTLDGTRVVTGVAEGLDGGEDKYGSRILNSRRFLPGAGFVVAGFKKEYAKLIGEHPQQFFDDAVLREPLAKAAGLPAFRDLRQASGVASPVRLVDGRYVVLHGCKQHDCAGNYSFVMIDAVTAQIVWARFEEGRNRYAGATRKLDRARLQTIISDPAFEQRDDAPLVVARSGNLEFKAATPRP